MRHGALVKHASAHVHADGDEEDDGKDAARAHAARLVRLDSGAGVRGPDIEEVGALVWRAADVAHDGLFAHHLVVADEGEGGRLAPLPVGLLLLVFFRRPDARLIVVAAVRCAQVYRPSLVVVAAAAAAAAPPPELVLGLGFLTAWGSVCIL